MRHHYIPQFYLRRWCNDEGKVFRYRKIMGRIVSDHIYPVQTAWDKDLYGLNINGKIYQELETEHFSKIDNDASLSIESIIKSGDKKLNASQIDSISKFVNSLDMRCPEDIDAHIGAHKDLLFDTDPEIEEEYIRKLTEEGLLDDPSVPKTLREYITQRTTEIDHRNESIISIVNLIEHGLNTQLYSKLIWCAKKVDIPSIEVMTCDRPLIKVSSLGSTDGSLILPVSPTVVLIACNNELQMKNIMDWDGREFLTFVNRNITVRSSNYVYSLKKEKEQNLFDMCTKTLPSIFELMMAFRP